jgi:hypothetical protein
VGEVLGLSIKDGSKRRDNVVKLRIPRPQQAEDPKKAEDIRRAHLRKYNAAMPLTHERAEPARRYLAGRGLSVADGDIPISLRFAPRMNYYHNGEKKGEWPALVAPMQSADGRFLNIHRIYLSEKGDKAPVEEVKQTGQAPRQRIMCGSAVRLAACAPVLGVAEGIETALAVQQVTGLPTWATVNATLLEQFVPPESVRMLLIWADLDRSNTGLTAAEKLSSRMRECGVLTSILLPEAPIPTGAKGVDWLDIVSRKGADALREQPLVSQLRRGG